MASGPQQEAGETLSEVNVIPLADLSLVLLIILMVLSPMIMQSMIKVQASRASQVKSLRDNPPEPPITVVIGQNDVVLMGNRFTDSVSFAAKLNDVISNHTDKTVLLTTEPTIQHGRFVQILDIVKQQGAEKIALLRKAGGKTVPLTNPASAAPATK